MNYMVFVQGEGCNQNYYPVRRNGQTQIGDTTEKVFDANSLTHAIEMAEKFCREKQNPWPSSVKVLAYCVSGVGGGIAHFEASHSALKVERI